MSLDKMSAEECYLQALALRERGEARRAAQMLQVAMIKDPKDMRFKRLKGELTASGEGKARVLAPPVRAQKNAARARAALALGKDEEAVDILRHLIKDDPSEVEHPLALATVLLRRDRSPECIGLARRACQLGPKRLECHLLMEEVYRHFGPASAADSTRRHIKRLSKGERGEVDLAAEHLRGYFEPPRRIEIVPPRGQYRRFGLLIGLFLTTGVLYGQFGPKGYVPMEIGPFAEALPVDGAALEPDTSQVVLTLEDSFWAGLSGQERRRALERAQGLGQKLGYRSVRMEDQQGENLGWADGERLYLWEENGWGRGKKAGTVALKGELGEDLDHEEAVQPATGLEESE